MNNPFQNDMFAVVWQAFRNLYPDKECVCEWVPEIRESEDGEPVWGLTDFGEDGTVWVFVLADVPVKHAVEILAYELAHVAVGVDVEHGERWENAFEAIKREYDRIFEDMYPEKGEDDAEVH